MALAIFLALFLLIQNSSAAVAPTYPGPGQVFRQGSQCEIQWNPDPSGQWNKMSIDLMTGSNEAMTVVTNVVRGLDGTDPMLSMYSWACPHVEPYSSIYFYQFTKDKNAANTGVSEGLVNETDGPDMPAWTTRFTIASADGTTVSPQHMVQPGGESFPWGVGKLVNTQADNNGSTVRTSVSLGGSNEPGSNRGADGKDMATSLTEEVEPPSQSVIVVIPAPPSYASAESTSIKSNTAVSSTVTPLVMKNSGSGASANSTTTTSRSQFENENVNAAWRRPMSGLTSHLGLTIGLSLSSLLIISFSL